jgi:hypothetical protein
MEYVILALGIVFLIEGTPYFVFPSVFKKLVLLMSSIPETRLRIIGFFVMMVGLLLIYISHIAF